MKLKHFLLTAFVLFTGVSGVYAGRKYVGFSSGNTHGNNLSAALTTADPNDTVFVAAGLYIASDEEFTVPANVTLIGGYEKGDIGANTRRYPGQFVPFTTSDLSATTEFTILDGNAHKTLPAQKHRVITVNAGGVVDGCLIRNGHVRNDHGGGVLLDGGKLYNSIVRGNVAMSKPDTSIESLGGGVFIKNDGELINCLVAYNMANDGYGVAAGTNGGKMINNTVTANTYSPVFAKIPTGTFRVYKPVGLLNRPGSGIEKWTQDITLNDFYLSRILTTQGQFAVFCAAMDVPTYSSGTIYGQINVDSLKKWPEPVNKSTVDFRYGITGSTNSGGQFAIFQNTTADSIPGLKYDAGVWHPVVDTATVEYPMGYVSWYGALAYSVWLGGGLPTLAQWQFAARRDQNGVTDNMYSGAYGTTSPNGIDTWRILDTIAWVHRDSSLDTSGTGYKTAAKWGPNRPHEVARKRPNAMGLYDMTGNIAEWNADWEIVSPGNNPVYGASGTDPINKTTLNYRIVNTGGYSTTNRASFSLTAYGGYYQYSLYEYIGFRPVVIF